MRKSLLYAILQLIVLSLCGCKSFEPPPRPVAYVFPTVREMSSLEDLEERNVSIQEIQNWMARAGIYDELRAYGMTDDDWHLLARGLRRGGYAELDARKTRLGFRWITISCLKNGSTEVMIGYDHDRGKAIRAGMVWQPYVLEETTRRCNMPNMVISDAWYGHAGNTDREFLALNSKKTGKTILWLKRLVFGKVQETN
ncbi:MAG: hypothetical protein J6X55_14880 [Victivallales bacterium]|nr:hypothetical protein [Victivallales bacterium]